MDEIFFDPAHLEEVGACPVCGGRESRVSYELADSIQARRCACGAYFCDHRLTQEGLAAYWEDYQNREHTAVEEECALRQRMYAVDFRYIAQFLVPGAKVLDVGCADGQFLDLFAEAGHTCCGVEVGHEAAVKAANRHRVWEGYFPSLNMGTEFDLIMFRGVLQYVQTPRDFFQKAASLLHPGGLVFITAQPNMDSFCHHLFKNKFRFRLTPCDCVGYTPGTLAAEFARVQCALLGEAFFYEETPYANPEKDIAAVHRAMETKARGGPPNEISPPFWGNLMTLVFRKR